MPATKTFFPKNLFRRLKYLSKLLTLFQRTITPLAPSFT